MSRDELVARFARVLETLGVEHELPLRVVAEELVDELERANAIGWAGSPWEMLERINFLGPRRRDALLNGP